MTSVVRHLFTYFYGAKMTIYQVIDEQNHLVYAFMSYQTAKEEVEMLNESREDHFYYVNKLEFKFEDN